MSATATKPRDLMAPDTDPTDEELEAVTRDVLNVVRERRAESDRRIAAALQQATQAVMQTGQKPERESK